MMYLLSFRYGEGHHTISGNSSSIWMIAHLFSLDGIKFTVIDHYGMMIDTKKGQGMEYFDAPISKEIKP